MEDKVIRWIGIIGVIGSDWSYRRKVELLEFFLGELVRGFRRGGEGIACHLKKLRINMAIASGVLVEIVLMILLGGIEINERARLDSYLSGCRCGKLMQRLLDYRTVGGVGIIDSGTVLRSTVVSLPVDRCGVYSAVIKPEKGFQRNSFRIVGNFHGFGSAGFAGAYIAIGGVGHRAVGIAYLSRDNTRNKGEKMLGAPEASSGEIDCFHQFQFSV